MVEESDHRHRRLLRAAAPPSRVMHVASWRA
jgi:hypothetical protein